MFDISKMAARETFDVPIKHPETGEQIVDKDKALSVTVFGPGTPTFATAKQEVSNRTMQRLKRRGKVDMTEQEERLQTANFLATCTKSFNNFNYKGKEGLDGFRALYADPAMGWITDQVNREMGDWANFTEDSATT